MTQVKLELAKAHATKMERKFSSKQEHFRRYRKALSCRINNLRSEMARLLSSIGVTTPALVDPAKVQIRQFFKRVRACDAMVELGGRLQGDLYTMISARTLAATVCGLLLEGSSKSYGITRLQLRWLCEENFKWPSEEDVSPPKLAILPKNMAKNFIGMFFKNLGASLVEHELLRMKDHVLCDVLELLVCGMIIF